MKKRPLAITLIALIYLLEPIGNAAVAALANNLPLFGSQGVFAHLIWSDWLILAMFPVVAAGVYAVRPWGWYLFIGFSVVLIGYNLLVFFFLNPNYDLALVIGFILVVTLICAVFFRRHVYSPYFNPRLRWWEVATRYKVSLDATLLLENGGEIHGHVLDISRTGCFVDCPGPIGTGEALWLKIHCAGTQIHGLGKVVREAPNQGYGILFQAMTRETRIKLARLIHTLESLGGRDREGAVVVAGQIPAKAFADLGHGLLGGLALRFKSAI